MSRKVPYSSVVKEEARKLFENYNPFPWLNVQIKRMEIFTRILFGLLVLSLFANISTDSDQSFWVTVGLAVLTGLIFFLVVLIRSVMEQEKIEEFKKEHADLANILWQ